MRPLSYLILIAIFFPLSMIAQSDLSQEEVDELQDLKKELEGAYQIQMLGTRAKPAVPLSLFETIASEQKEDEVVYHKVGDKMRVKILPRRRTEGADPETVKKRVVHLEGKSGQE